jgi:gamma-glutamyl-gamma-aminobutyraldehyde dehydrogenase
VTLEMGGKNPAIVLDDAENLDRVAAHVVNGAFWNMGENCSASSRLIVHEGVKDALLERILPRMPANGRWAIRWTPKRASARWCRSAFQQGCSYLGKDVKVLIGGKAEAMFVEPTV